MMDAGAQVKLTLYLACSASESQRIVERLARELDRLIGPTYQLRVVDVLSVPEDALEVEVFATPALVRTLPPPVVRLIGPLVESGQVVAVVNQAEPGTGLARA